MKHNKLQYFGDGIGLLNLGDKEALAKTNITFDLEIFSLYGNRNKLVTRVVNCFTVIGDWKDNESKFLTESGFSSLKNNNIDADLFKGIVEELESLVNDTKINHTYFIDDSILLVFFKKLPDFNDLVDFISVNLDGHSNFTYVKNNISINDFELKKNDIIVEYVKKLNPQLNKIVTRNLFTQE